ncbi:hypothetical protein I2I11_04330 [Pontibacter sp. 172403-2]|uniref:hypothetical protein n=1 Tax=Pontibacter rufus TaxID=2791028 RepID=UPI0018AFB7CC|nr:hypothetical protein [Pontibacter sp. 172403-2]MBF9252512.1 hypothetical protein [Pontibacter sp. 172403-2]
MFILQSILPLLFASFFFNAPSSLLLQQDIVANLEKLQNDSRFYISDNASPSPSLQTVASDLQLFGVAASIDLSQATYSSRLDGNHLIEKWAFPDGQIEAIYQIQSTIHLDTVVTQRYLDNRAPTQQHITNDFTFRTYAVSAPSAPVKLYYLTEADQGLLEYRINDRQVQIGYADKKEGLRDVLPQVEKEIKDLLSNYVE